MGLKQVYFALRDQVRFAWAQRKYGYEPQGKVEDFDFAKLKHIVILKLDGKLGDTQVMTHFYRNLKNLPHKPTLSVVCPENLASVYYDVLGFDQVLVSSRKPRLNEIKSLCQQIIAASQGAGNNGKIDLVLSTEPTYRPRDFIFNSMLQPDFIAGCDPKVKSINLFIFHPHSYNHLVSTAFCDLMAKGHLDYSQPVAYTPLFTPETLERALKYVRPNFIESAASNEVIETALAVSLRFNDGEFVFGFNPLGAPKARQMSVETSAQLISLMLQSAPNTKVLLMCHSSKSEYIQAVVSKIAPELLDNAQGKSRLLVMPHNTSVLDLGALVHTLDALITVDTATVHMGCASKIAQLCFYDNDGVESCRWAPIGHWAQCVKFSNAAFGTMEPQAFTLVAKSFIAEQVGKY